MDLDTPVSVLEGIREAVGDKAEINYARGSNLTYDEELEKRASHWGKGFPRDGRTDSQLQREALDIANQSDIIIAVMGEAAEMSGEVEDSLYFSIRQNFRLPLLSLPADVRE